jgi:hypothetical protein
MFQRTFYWIFCSKHIPEIFCVYIYFWFLDQVMDQSVALVIIYVNLVVSLLQVYK